MKSLSFQGTHFEIGQQMGAFYARNRVVFPTPPDPDLLAQQITFYERHAPEILDELRGIAAGGPFPFASIAHQFLAHESHLIRNLGAAISKKSCSIGGFIDRKDQAWVVRNYDWQAVIKDHFQTWHFTLPEGQMAVVSDMGIMGPADVDPSKQLFCPDDAINAHGLMIGLTFAYCWTTGIGLTTADALRLVAMRCKNVDEALHFFAETPLCSAKNFFIADKTNAMAVVQHAVTDYEVIRPDANGLLVLANHYAGRLAPIDQVPPVAPHSATFARSHRLLADLAAIKNGPDPISFDRLSALMTNDTTPVCQYFPDIQVETVWTLLTNQTAQDYRLIEHPRAPDRHLWKLTPKGTAPC